MNRTEKIVRAFLASSSEASFEDVKRVLIEHGFEEVRSKGSHHNFRHENGRKQTVPTVGGRKVKRVYIQEIIELLNLEESYVQEEKEN